MPKKRESDESEEVDINTLVHPDADIRPVVADVMQEPIAKLAWCPSRDEFVDCLKCLAASQIVAMSALFQLDCPGTQIQLTWKAAAEAAGVTPSTLKGAYIQAVDQLYNLLAPTYLVRERAATEKRMAQAHPLRPEVVWRRSF